MASTREMRTSNAKPPVVCVFCASSPGTNPIHLSAARSLAQSLHNSNSSLVYGGGTRGIMGELSRTLVSLSGPSSVQGIIPRALIQTEEGYSGTAVGHQANSALSAAGKEAEKTMPLEDLKKIDSQNGFIKESEYGVAIVVVDMHTRKRLMAQKVIEGGAGSGFVALAGGYGTMEEVMEMVTWNQLGIHHMPIVLVNIDGYWDGLLEWVRKSVKEGFVGEGHANILMEVKETREVVEALKNYQVAPARYQLDWSK